MKRLFGFAVLLSLVSIPAFAAKNAQSISLADTVTVGTTKLPAGDYKVTWTGAAPNVQVTIEQKDAPHATVTVPAKLVDAKNDHPSTTTNSAAGTAKLEQIDLKNVSLVLTNSPASGQ